MSIPFALKLSPDLFTPLARTPWAGLALAKTYKHAFAAVGTRIGESWEVSCDPTFPSRVMGADGDQMSLAEMIHMRPDDMLSPAYVKAKGPNCEILVKLLNANDPLSVQVHPTDQDSSLRADESGKPESWLVLDAEPGSGLYLGFSQPVALEKLRQLLLADADLRPYLQFVPVRPGDYFEIQPGVLHAIGPGVTLLEPQRVLHGKSGKTYRFWDWSRRYNPDGSENRESGKPRDLHIEEGLRLINPEQQVGMGYVNALKRIPHVHDLGPRSEIAIYPPNAYYQLHRLKIRSGMALQTVMKDGFATLVTLKGRVRMGEGPVFVRGEPGFLPYSAFPMELKAEEDSDLALVIPTGAKLLYPA